MSVNLVRNFFKKPPVTLLKFIGHFWMPYIGAGVQVDYVAPDFRKVEVSLKFRWYNKNYVGTHFGGSIYAMTDPFYMLMLLENLGRDYIVWDKAAKIDFKKPGKTHLKATFEFSESEIAEIKKKADELGKYIFDRPVDIFDTNGEVVASVIKTLYVRKKT